MPDLHSLPANVQPTSAIRNNGPPDLALERHKLRELAEGWPMYRDACEWENLLSLFHPDAHIYTTWTGRTHHLDFIAASKAGMDRGAFIMHRCCGSTTDIDPTGRRAVTKMKAVITQRFSLPVLVSKSNGTTTTTAATAAGEEEEADKEGKTCEVDAESDCRFIFFWEKETEGELAGQWRARLARHFYEKDKLIPVDPRRVPWLDDAKLAEFPPGYRYLGYCQEVTMGVTVLKDLPGHRREGSGTVNGRKHDEMYRLAKEWIEGRDIEI